MLLQFTGYEQLDTKRMLHLYREGTEVNLRYFYPQAAADPASSEYCEARQKVEQRFLDFLQDDFFAVPGSLYAVLEEDGSWVSALRLAPVESGWYLESLETDPDFRRRGCAKRLIRQVIAKLEEDGPVTIWDSVAKTNAASLATHSSCGLLLYAMRATATVPGRPTRTTGVCGTGRHPNPVKPAIFLPSKRRKPR